ncbi:STAS/SEC14 domain-containing protein [Shimia ponticola]|uniref:STAS/SEC14 domain-containing protein n=1 Tax=Shimia ponticola TaxID=2582893 RepID=UPI0011BDDA80|nr:STAS/SEC14 domain-containing protein [Shimia ponticola]
MFKITKPSENRVDITIDGEIDQDTMRNALWDLLAKSEGVSDGRMYYTLTNFEMPSLAAIGVEMTFLPKLFGLLSKFSKCALVADAAWLRKAAEIEGALIPGLEIKGFEVGQEAEAEAWLAA